MTAPLSSPQRNNIWNAIIAFSLFYRKNGQPQVFPFRFTSQYQWSVQVDFSSATHSGLHDNVIGFTHKFKVDRPLVPTIARKTMYWWIRNLVSNMTGAHVLLRAELNVETLATSRVRPPSLDFTGIYPARLPAKFGPHVFFISTEVFPSPRAFVKTHRLNRLIRSFHHQQISIHVLLRGQPHEPGRLHSTSARQNSYDS